MRTGWMLGCVLVVGLLFSDVGVRAGEERVQVFVSIVPQKTFVKRIGGDRVAVDALVSPGSSPATYEPIPRQMAALSRAELYLRIGVPFENAVLPKIRGTYPDLRIVDTRNGIRLRTMKAHVHGDAHEHGERDHSEEHGHEEEERKGTDPHIWLDPLLVTQQARTIADALIEVDPDHEAVYEDNYAEFAESLDRLDAELGEALAPVKGETLFVFHPAWGYFADRYGLEQEPVEIEGKEPSARQLAQIVSRAKTEGVKVIFVQPQFSQASARQIARAIDGAVVPIDPLAANYIENLRTVARKVRNALGKSG